MGWEGVGHLPSGTEERSLFVCERSPLSAKALAPFVSVPLSTPSNPFVSSSSDVSDGYSYVEVSESSN